MSAIFLWFVQLLYSTAQLQSNVCTHPKRVLHAFQMQLTRVPDMSSSGEKGA